jgi:hypothetical protein
MWQYGFVGRDRGPVEVLSQPLPGDNVENHERPEARITGVQAAIRIRHLPNTNPEP